MRLNAPCRRASRRSGGSLGQQAEDLLHLGGVEGTGRLRPDVAQRPQVQEGGGGRRLVGGLADDHAVEGPKRPVLRRHLDAQLLRCGLRLSKETGVSELRVLDESRLSRYRVIPSDPPHLAILSAHLWTICPPSPSRVLA